MIFSRSLRKPWWWLVSFVKKQRRLITLTAMLSILALVAGKRIVKILPQLAPETKIGVVDQYTLNTLPPSVNQQLGRGLFKFNQNGEVVPDLAHDWETGENETVYRVSLPSNLYWNDLSALISRDLEFNLPEVEVSYPDDLTIEFRLKQPYSPFLTLLTTPLFKNQTVGIGEFSLTKMESSGQYLKRISLNGSRQKLTYVFYPSQPAAWLGFRLGEVDRLENLLINPVAGQWEKKVKLESRLNRQAYLAILFNLNDANLSSKPLRQALAYAIANKADSAGSRAISPISPDSWAYNSEVKPYNHQPDQAQELFAKFEEEGSPSAKLEVTLGTSASFLELAESVAESWKQVLPVEVNVKIVNSIEPDFQAILIAQEIPLDPDQHALWHSTQKNNISHYSDLKVDKLLEDGRQISDQKQRQEIYRDFQRFLVEDSPVVFLSHPVVYTISRK